MNKYNTTHKLICSVLVGAAIGGIAAILFTPKSGKELRKDVSKQTHKAIDTAEDYMNMAKDKGSDVLETAKETGSDLKKTGDESLNKMSNKVGGAAELAKESFTDTADQKIKQAGHTYEQATSRTKEILEETAKEVKDKAKEAKHEAKKL